MNRLDPDKRYGKGIGFPVRIGDDGRVAWSSGAQNIRESMRIILMTELNQRLLLPRFGCGLQNYLFEPNTVSTRRLIEDSVTQALGLWESRIALDSVTVEADESEPTTAVVSIKYKMIANDTWEKLSLTLTFNN